MGKGKEGKNEREKDRRTREIDDISKLSNSRQIEYNL